jgi:hypothetical protein
MSSRFIRWGGLAGMLGGLLWAVTPLRDVVFGGGGTSDHPVFRPYNAVLVVVAVLLIMGLVSLHARYKETYRRLGRAGVVLAFGGYALVLAGSIPAVLLDPDDSFGLIRAGQDLGFFGALLAAVGAVFLGIALWRTQAAPRLAALLLIVTLPVGFAGIFAISSIGLVSIAGLAMTGPYGAAWMILGNHLRSSAGESPAVRISGAREVS